MSLNSPRGAPTAPPPKPSPREIAQARDWLDDVLPDGAKQEAKDQRKMHAGLRKAFALLDPAGAGRISLPTFMRLLEQLRPGCTQAQPRRARS